MNHPNTGQGAQAPALRRKPSEKTQAVQKRNTAEKGHVHKRKPAVREPINAHPVAFLPFVHTPANVLEVGRDLWAVPSSGSYVQNHAIGRAFGREMLAYMRKHEAPQGVFSILGIVVKQMVLKGDDGQGCGTVLGFMAVVAEAVLQGGKA